MSDLLLDEDDFTHYFKATERLSKENATLRAKCERLEKALDGLTINANRILDVYPVESRGTYYEDLTRSVAVARVALNNEEEETRG